MIQFSNEDTMPLVKQMWKICFDDVDSFINLFFAYQYKDHNTLIYCEGDIVVASLQMIPYTINFCGKEIPFAYLAGLSTLPEYRNKGYMSQLIHYAHSVLKARNIPLSILVPAEDWLFKYYEKFDYVQVFDKSEKPIYSLSKILEETSDIKSAYSLFDSLYRHKDFCVQKNFEDFKIIVEEYINDGSPDKYDLAAMACIMDEQYLLRLFAEQNPSLNITLQVGQSTYYLAGGRFSKTDDKADFQIDVRQLCRLLFGYKTNELEEPFKNLFKEHHPVINLMLE